MLGGPDNLEPRVGRPEVSRGVSRQIGGRRLAQVASLIRLVFELRKEALVIGDQPSQGPSALRYPLSLVGGPCSNTQTSHSPLFSVSCTCYVFLPSSQAYFIIYPESLWPSGS